MTYQLITYTVDDRKAIITLHRPEKRNALNATMVVELTNAFQEAKTDDTVKVIILKGEGKAFSAGADLGYLQQLQNNSYEENLADSQQLMGLFQAIYNHPKIVIAQVEGHAIAGGCGLATVCDFVFAVPEAMLGYSEVRIGFVPAIVSLFLLRKVGEAKAKQLLLTGHRITAVEAEKIGLVNFLESPVAINEKVQVFADKLIRQCADEALALTKSLIANVQHLSINDALSYAAEVNAKARATDNCKKGIAAFLNKEEINW